MIPDKSRIQNGTATECRTTFFSDFAAEKIK